MNSFDDRENTSSMSGSSLKGYHSQDAGHPSKTGNELDAFGATVRRLRLQGHLTLVELSSRSGLSQSTLSKIENGNLSPTYEKIVALANGLGVDVSALFARKPADTPTGRRSVTRKGSGTHHPTPQYDYEMLCTDVSGKEFMPLTAKIKARSIKAFPQLPKHEGEEFLYVLHGEVVLYSDFYEPLRLLTGDSCYFDSAMGHAVVAGAEDAEVLWVCSKNVNMSRA